jgi:hypothetical protein
LRVPKTENITIPSTHEPSSQHATTGVPCSDAPAALSEVKSRVPTHNSNGGCRAYEHRESVEVSHGVRDGESVLACSCDAAERVGTRK